MQIFLQKKIFRNLNFTTFFKFIFKFTFFKFVLQDDLKQDDLTKRLHWIWTKSEWSDKINILFCEKVVDPWSWH